MGLADFLADAGRGTAIGQVAQAFGGQTTGRRNLDTFVNQELPALVDQIHKAGTKEDVTRAGQALITSGLKAGIPAQSLDKLMEMTIGPALQNLRSGEIDKIKADYGSQPAQPRPEGTEGPLTPGGNFIDPKQGRPLDFEGALRLGQATGATSPQMREWVGTPADIAGKELSNKKTQAALEADQAKESAIQGLSNQPLAQGLPSLRDLGRINPAGIVQTLPQREKPEDPLLEERRGLLGAQMDAERARADAARARAGESRGGGGGRGSLLMQDFVKSGGDSQDVEGFMEYAGKRRQAGAPGTTTTTEGPVDPVKKLEVEAVIAKMAQDRGRTDTASLKKIANEMGYELEGNPTIEGPGGLNTALSTLGVQKAAAPRLKGDFSLTPKSKTVTRTPSGAASKAPPGQGRYSEGVPSGSAPTSDNDPLGIRPKRR